MPGKTKTPVSTPKGQTDVAVARMRNIALQYGTPNGMLGCSIRSPHEAFAWFKLTRGYAVVEIDGTAQSSGFLLLREDAVAAWDRFIRIPLSTSLRVPGSANS